MATANEIARQCKDILKEYYGPQFGGLILYGSTARGEESSASDIDLLVLLSKPFDYLHELRRIVDLLYSVQLESKYLISARPAAKDEFEHGVIQLYRNAKEEGQIV
jgi:predicted nucleotidyltransferase